MKYLILFFLIVFSTVLAKAQSEVENEEEQIPASTVRIDSSDRDEYVDTLGVGFWKKLIAPTYPNPERAAAMSFVLPGSGQIYNKKFWYIKVPVIYAGYSFLIWRGEQNRGLRNDYQTAYLLSLDGMTHEFSDQNLSSATLRIRRDQFDKNFQLSYIGVVILHFVQTLEAYTTAHLLEFDMDESLTIAPTLIPSDPMGFGGSKPGIKIGVQLGGR